MQPQIALTHHHKNGRPMATALLRALERFAAPQKIASGVFRLVDEFAGIERLDREELDETDSDGR
jgi:hypothetical protein